MDTNRAEYQRNYTNGWRASQNDGAYPENKPDAYVDGYNDFATGAPKWHRRDCPLHGTYVGTEDCGFR